VRLEVAADRVRCLVDAQEAMILDTLTTTELIDVIQAIDRLTNWRASLARELKRRERLDEFNPVRLKKRRKP
jgi:hypothetical protein